MDLGQQRPVSLERARCVRRAVWCRPADEPRYLCFRADFYIKMIDMFFSSPDEVLAGFCGDLKLKNSFFEFAPLAGVCGAYNG
jgi:hypothetical protein